MNCPVCVFAAREGWWGPTFAWFVGVFEGEGSIVLQRGRPTLILGMTDEDVIRRIHAITGVGYVFVSTREKRRNAKPMWTWAVSRQDDTARLLIQMLPLLGTRRLKRAEEALSAWQYKKDQADLAKHLRGLREHGQRRTYWAGCRCDECRAGNAAYEYARRRRPA